MGYTECTKCGFIFASPTTDPRFEFATYNLAKASQAMEKEDFWSNENAKNLYQTHHKWVDIVPFLVSLGFHFQRFRNPKNPGQRQLSLLDIGCGYGHTLELARVFGLLGVGCDIDEFRLKVCRDKGLRVVTPTEVRGAFDIICSCNVIEHVYDLESYLSMVSEKLAPDGIFVFSGLEKSVINIELRAKHFKLLHPVEHRNIFTRGSLERALGAHDLRLVTRSELFKAMKNVRSKAPLYLGYWLNAGFVKSRGVFSAIAIRN